MTVDRNLRFQQNITGRTFAIVVLIGQTNELADLVPLMPATLAALASIQPGTIVEIGP